MDTVMTAHEASSSSSSKSKLWNYDVFLSFSGEDTRKGFTGHLHAALKAKGYKVFIDDDDLERGEEIKKKLMLAIEESRISIIVFSKKYVDSSWCLDELVKIMDCKSELGRYVLPIFYHVDPSHVRKQNGDFARAFKKHERNIRKEKDDKERETKKEKVKRWRKALTKAADLSGHHIQITDNRREATLIREIVDKITTEWHPCAKELDVAKYPVGIDSRVQDIISRLSGCESDDIIMVGIWGMGGLGKTTVAKAIYNQIHHTFAFKSFLADVSSTTSKHGLVYLQEKLISDTLKQEIQISNVDEGISLIQGHFSHRRVFVIMDNIDDEEQLDAIARNHNWFGPGSRIIITTRNEHLLKQVEVDKTYPAQKLNDEEALKLFSWHAFGNSRPNKSYLELSKQVVSYCEGLPLALKVLGSSLCTRPIVEWESELKNLERTPDGKIIERLRISFNGLNGTEKAIFFDISCFFLGWNKDYVTKVLDECGFSSTIVISRLRERCLVTVEDNELNMHDLLRETARVIISENSPDEPGKWSRLWNPREITNVLTNKSGTEKVGGLALDFPDPWLPSSNKSSCFSTEAFANMTKLRLLQLNNVQLNGEFKHLSKELIWLCWRGFHLQSIPDDFFNQKKLVFLEMQHSKLVQVWKGSQALKKLKTLNLSSSYLLKKSPDFSHVPNLQELILDDCMRLSEIHPSIGHLKRLSVVSFKGCHMLRSLPRDFYKLTCVECLYLTRSRSFGKLPEDLGKMTSLRKLEADFTTIRQVPSSIVGLNHLTRLSLKHVKGIHLPYSLHGLNSLRELDLSLNDLADDEIPKDLGSLISLQDLNLEGNNFHTLPSLNGLSKLETLRLNESPNLHTIPDLPTNLKFLYASDSPALEAMPNFLEMSNMRELDVGDSSKLTEIPGLEKSLNSMTWIDMKWCTILTADFRKNILQGWTSCGFGGIVLHGNYVPDWFEFVNEGNKFSFDIPLSNGRNVERLALFFCSRFPVAITVINNNKGTELRASIGRENWKHELICTGYYLWHGQLSNNKLNLQGGDNVDIIFGDSDTSWAITRTGVNIVWDKHMKENVPDLDCVGYVFDPHPARFYGDAPSASSSSSSSHI